MLAQAESLAAISNMIRFYSTAFTPKLCADAATRIRYFYRGSRDDSGIRVHFAQEGVGEALAILAEVDGQQQKSQQQQQAQEQVLSPDKVTKSISTYTELLHGSGGDTVRESGAAQVGEDSWIKVYMSREEGSRKALQGCTHVCVGDMLSVLSSQIHQHAERKFGWVIGDVSRNGQDTNNGTGKAGESSSSNVEPSCNKVVSGMTLGDLKRQKAMEVHGSDYGQKDNGKDAVTQSQNYLDQHNETGTAGKVKQMQINMVGSR